MLAELKNNDYEQFFKRTKYWDSYIFFKNEERLFYVDNQGIYEKLEIKNKKYFQETCKECKPDGENPLQLRLTERTLQKFFPIIVDSKPNNKIKGQQLYQNKIYLISNLQNGVNFGPKYFNCYVFFLDNESLFYVNEYGIKAELTITDKSEFKLISTVAKTNNDIPLQERLGEEYLCKFWDIIKKNEEHQHERHDYYDIRKHESGTIFHMSPGYPLIGLYQLHKEIESRNRSLYEESLSFISRFGFFNVHHQVAFANTGGKNYDKEKKEEGLSRMTELRDAQILYRSLTATSAT